MKPFGVLLLFGLPCILSGPAAHGDDHLRELQSEAFESGKAAWGYWGADPEKYISWSSHSNRLIPVYTFGGTLDKVQGERSVYRHAQRLTELYGRLPEATHNPKATYFDQSDIARLQSAAAEAGKKYIVLFVFDGMDYETTRAAAIVRSGGVKYDRGRGTGLHFQDYRGAPTDFGYYVTSPYSNGGGTDVNAQVVTDGEGGKFGGYDPLLGGATPWQRPRNPLYLLAKADERPHAYTDSASSATSLTSGIKTYNAAINVDPQGRQTLPIGRILQQQGRSIGIVTSVPISHATPAAAYANNVSRDDYQDLSRDLVGLPSIAHRGDPLPGVDVLIGAGWGDRKKEDKGQGANFIPGNRYLTEHDLRDIDVDNGGRYIIAQRTCGRAGAEVLREATAAAVAGDHRLLGFFGISSPHGSHLPYRTADGDFNPTRGSKSPESYRRADVEENPTLAEMTSAALAVLEKDPDGFWLMVEPGDVDWANHDNNIDTSIGAVHSGDDAFRAVTEWAEARDCWDETLVILTADHGHALVLVEPQALLPPDGRPGDASGTAAR